MVSQRKGFSGVKPKGADTEESRPGLEENRRDNQEGVKERI